MEIYFNTYNDTSCTYHTVSFHRRSQGGDKGSIIIVTMLENLSGLLRAPPPLSFGLLVLYICTVWYYMNKKKTVWMTPATIQFFWLQKSSSVSVVPHFAFRMMWSKLSPCNSWYAAQWSRNGGGGRGPVAPPTLNQPTLPELDRCQPIDKDKAWICKQKWRTLLNDNTLVLLTCFSNSAIDFSSCSEVISL